MWSVLFCATDAARQAGRETGKRKGESVLITISHLTKIFEGKGPRVTALEDVNLEIGKGDIYGIIGMSGAGKSTLLRCLTLLERPTSGQIMLAVPPCFALSSRKKPQPLRPRMKRVTARHCNGCARHALAKGSRTQLRGHVQLCPLCSLPPAGSSLKKPAQLTLLVIVFCVYSILYTSFRGCQADFSAAVRPAALRRAPASGPFGNAKTR